MTKLALIGFGRWGKNLARVMNELGVLGAVIEHAEDQRTEAHLRYPDVGLARSLNVCANDLRNMGITGVVLATPADTHFGMATLALESGFHVFTEKPMALSVSDASNMLLASKISERKLFVGHVFEYHPAVEQIVQLVKSGYLGSVEYISSHQLGPGRVRDRENVIFSLAPHDVSMVLRIMGADAVIGVAPRSVSAFGVSHCAQHGIAGTSVILVDFGAARAHIHVSWMSPQKRRQLTVIGSRRAIVFDDVGKKLTAYDRTNDIGAYAKESSDIFYDDTTEPIRLEMEAFVRYLETGVEPPTSGARAIQVVKVLEAADMSMKNASVAVDVLG